MIPDQEDVRFHATTEFNQRLDLIRHLIRNSDRILLVRGDSGMGKSTLLAWLQRLADQEWSICRLDATPMLQPDNLLHQLAADFGIDPQSGDLFGALVRRMDDLHQVGRLPLILVDDAHLLPVPSLILLFRIHEHLGQGGLPLRLVLFALPQIDDLLNTPQLQTMESGAVQRIELAPMDLRQTERFVRQILQAGEAAAKMPSTTRLARLHRDSGGRPGEVERLARRLLHGGAGEATEPPRKRRGILAGLSWPVLAAAGGVAFLLLLTLVFQDRINAFLQGGKGEQEEAPLVDDGRIVPLPIPQQEPLSPAGETGSGAQTTASAGEPVPATATEPERPPVEAPPVLALPELEPLPQRPPPAAAPPQAEEKGPASRPAEVVAPARGTAPGVAVPATPPPREAPVPAQKKAAVAQPAPPSPPEPAPAAVGAGTGAPAGSPEAPPAPAPIEELSTQGTVRKPKPAEVSPPPPREAARAAAPAPAPVEERAPKPVPPAPPKKSAPASGGVHDEAWLLQRTPSRYALQLVGVQDEDSARSFIRRHHLSGPVAYFRTTRNGRPWYAVVYGDFASRADAVAARTRLPGRLARSGAWPRTFASVQQAIRNR
ncbi:MAG TPA: hypothetical protein ENI96_13160 [Sedimenticola thiotaurini]|uniref:SPOR domain-containing protein n=1 Tax=Sedimenticola thiotaurini TaxID=1543721 RepID=A0A831RQW4_9GAMM|nr:hypothetical protein [Sedimenticola thiotaurini]